MTPVRGQVYFVDLGEKIGKKPFVVLSNNIRNRALNTSLAVRITTTNRNNHLPTVVPLGPDCGDLAGWALCDDIEKLWHDELPSAAGALGTETMMRINVGVRVALGL
jgi:mRNA interferase MazF